MNLLRETLAVGLLLAGCFTGTVSAVIITSDHPNAGGWLFGLLNILFGVCGGQRLGRILLGMDKDEPAGREGVSC